MSEKKKFSPTAARNLKIMVAVFGVALTIAGYIAWSFSQKKATSAGPSEIPQVTEQKTDADPNRPLPDNYGAMLKDKNIEQAQNAAQSGTSYVPDFVSPYDPKYKPNPVDQTQGGVPFQNNPMVNQQNGNMGVGQQGLQNGQAPQNAGMPDGVPNMPPPSPPQAPQLDQSKLGQFNEFATKWKTFAPSVSTQPVFKIAKETKDTTSSQTDNATTDTSGTQKDPEILVQAGQSAYAVIDMSINTDEPSVVFARILNGKLKGSSIMGDAKRNVNNTVSVTFNKLTMKGKPTMQVNAVVVDPVTGRTSLEGEVNHKLVERFVLPVTAAVVAKYGDLVGKQGTVMVQTPTVGGMNGMGMGMGVPITQNLSKQQLRQAALGEGAKVVAENIRKEAQDVVPSVTLPNQLGVTIKFVEDVMVQ